MHDKLKLLLDKISLPEEYYEFFNNGKILKLKLDHTRRNGVFVIEIDNPLDTKVLEYIDKNMKKGFPEMGSIKSEFVLRNANFNDCLNYYKEAILKSTLTKPMKELFIEKKVKMSGDTLIIDTDNIAEENILNNHLESILKYYKVCGYPNLKIKTFINEENRLKVKKELEEEIKMETQSKPKEENPVILGDEPKGAITEIKDIIAEESGVTVEAYVFGVEEFESSRSAFKILTFKISDNTDSIYAKIFTKDADLFKMLSKKMKSGWFRINGYVKQDIYAKDLVLNIRNVMKIPSKDMTVVDDAKEKRVELHAHTMMSQMDGITKSDLGKHTCELVTNAINMGYRGVAITDHNGCQAFPIAYSLIKNHNKKIEDKSKHFKGLYGTELTLVDDTVNIVVRPTPDSLMDNTYVVFDTETTGFNAAGEDQMIEIGAVKVRDGEVVDTFSELINPGIPVPERITELTGITTEMVEDKPGIENVLPQFIEFAGNDMILGHNVRFDYGFLKQNAINLNLQFDKSGLDTLKIARKTLPKEWSKGLENLCRIFGIEDKNHHRAYNDAEVTSKLYMILMNQYGNEFPGLFEAEEFIYKVKKMQPITEKQKKYLIALIRYHNLEIDYEIDSLSKNEASRKIDKIIAENGKIFD